MATPVIANPGQGQGLSRARLEHCHVSHCQTGPGTEPNLVRTGQRQVSHRQAGSRPVRPRQGQGIAKSVISKPGQDHSLNWT